MTPANLTQRQIDGLREVRACGAKGLSLCPHGRFFCSGLRMNATIFQALAGHGLVEVIGGKILISAAGLGLLDGVP